ncbi:NDR1/HIN1-Like protein 3-like protein [Cinnamomum micranthum f. kanehirae]|uniref:NDR1/HIN1-Like protein 3-like protein n=1 Tax=Cinnamomum micranthum f. kanehirae TaxID=337451 RepID=A0A3S3NRV3_9MAGN|nr:NDR1/HIN1-Like protein 3-like protein [Cinnamomum micranthum f. kanehirae]
MAETKQSHLNGAYYGPPIPPKQSYHRPGRGSGLCCGPCCILSALLKLIITIIVVLGIIVLVLWLVLRPSKVKVYVENASLTQFNLTDNTLYYNLTLDMSVRNPNKRVGIYYDRLEATAYYDENRFAYTTLPSFYQGHKNTSMLYPVFSGESVVALGSSGVADFNQDKSQGSFDIFVRVNLRIRFKVGPIKTNRYKPKFECDLKLPLSSDGSTATGFTRTKCDIDF